MIISAQLLYFAACWRERGSVHACQHVA